MSKNLEVIQEDDDKYASPKPPSRASNYTSKTSQSKQSSVAGDKASRNKGPKITDGQGVYDSTDSKKVVTDDNSSGYKMKSFNLPGAGLKNQRQSVMNLKLKKQQLAQSALEAAGIDMSSPAKKVKRASITYQNGESPVGRKSIADDDEMQIENDRLKTTLMILTQKLKLKEDDQQGHDERWQAQVKSLQQKIESRDKDIQTKTRSLDDRDQEIDRLKSDMQEQANSLEDGGLNEKKMKDLNRQLEFQVDELMEQLANGDESRKNLKNQLKQANAKLVELEEELYGSKQTAAQLIQSLKEAEDEHQVTLDEQHKLQSDYKQLEEIHDALQVEYDTAFAEKDEHIASLEAQLAALQKEFQDHMEGHEKTIKEKDELFNSTVQEKDDHLSKTVKEKDDHLSNTIQEKDDHFSKTVKEKTEKHDQTTKENAETHKQTVKENKENHKNEMTKKCDQHAAELKALEDKYKALLKAQEEKFRKWREEQEEKYRALLAENQDLKGQCGDLEGLQAELAKLRLMNKKLRYSVYIPKKDENVDRMLGDYVNGRPENDSMKIMFLRESEGVYRFGQKRVYIKAEQGGKISVRVGGGFMGIDEFVRTYEVNEYDKIQKKDVLGRFNQTAQIHRLASKADEARESSPIRSPKRASGKHKRINSALGSPSKSSTQKNAYASTPSKVYQKDWIQEKK